MLTQTSHLTTLSGCSLAMWAVMAIFHGSESCFPLRGAFRVPVTGAERVYEAISSPIPPSIEIRALQHIIVPRFHEVIRMHPCEANS